MLLKMFVLSGSAVILWLAPLVSLDKKIGWHKSAQGLSLAAAVSCAIGAGNIARRLAEENEIEEIKARAIKADVVDEISTEVYVSQKQRQQGAEALLNEGSERSRTIEMLERALTLDASDEQESEPERSEGSPTSGTKEQESEPERSPSDLTPEEQVLAERIMNLKIRGYGKAKIISEIWGVSKGGSQKYKAAEAEYKRLVEDDAT